MHSVKLSRAVVKVDIKVINADLTQNQCLQCVAPVLMHAEITRQCDVIELNNDGMIKLGDVHYQTEPNMSERDLINDDSSVCSQILLTIDLHCHAVPFGKLVLNVSLCL